MGSITAGIEFTQSWSWESDYSKHRCSPCVAPSYRASFHFQVRHHNSHKANYYTGFQADDTKTSFCRNHRGHWEWALPRPTSNNSKGLGTHSLCPSGEARLALALHALGEDSSLPAWHYTIQSQDNLATLCYLLSVCYSLLALVSIFCAPSWLSLVKKESPSPMCDKAHRTNLVCQESE